MKVILPQKVESRLNRDSSRRKSSVSQAAAKTNAVERQAAMLEQHTALQKSLERAEAKANAAEVKALAARERAALAAAEEAKAHASASTMRKLHTQLQERKVAALQAQSVVLQEDAEERDRLAKRLNEHVAATSAEASRAEGESEHDSPTAQNRQLRASLLALADDFDAKQKAHRAALLVYGATAGTLEAELNDVGRAVASAEATAAEQKQVRDAIDAFSEKFRGFADEAATSKSKFSARTEALGVVSARRRSAMIDVQEAKAGRALAKKELSAALERVAAAEAALRHAEVSSEKVAKLRDALRERVEQAAGRGGGASSSA